MIDQTSLPGSWADAIAHSTIKVQEFIPTPENELAYNLRRRRLNRDKAKSPQALGHMTRQLAQGRG
ncbi:hypothetical protein [Novosphingobium sp. MMS21-SN21R]|uniref:hypothetical protein n=1 Tax=Novosphingobium sp. MMS21-SN21R TaxID=2969298 RepID=UPI0028888F9F|nr:hypothetical protein [Novosphingobium sp. MMS21-SN21R]MDT0507518.1 hypothetical protein [Novosphingobium sp. MMS21-SN21R]